jgi:hypothetical protein
MNWYLSLPPAEAQVACGTQTHAVRWESGQIALPAHPDAEAELVLAALGGDKPRCVEVAETWAGHASDLDVLMTCPRSRADQVRVSWDDAEEHQTSWFGLAPGLPGSFPGVRRSRSAQAGPAARLGQLVPGHNLPADLLRRVQARIDMLHLLSLGPAFQFRLAGTVAAAWATPRPAAGNQASAGREDSASQEDNASQEDSASGEDQPNRRPELTAALTGRLAPAVAEWLGISPDSVTAIPLGAPSSSDPSSQRREAPRALPTPPPPSSWGSLEITGSGADRRVRAALRIGWLASVWACGLPLVDGHLVVAVEEPGWPRARVIALPGPGEAPVSMEVTGTDDEVLPRWTIER